MTLTAEINEADYGIGGSFTAFVPVGEYGPLDCECCAVAIEIDPVGPRLVMLMMRKDAEPHEHTWSDFAPPERAYGVTYSRP